MPSQNRPIHSHQPSDYDSDLNYLSDVPPAPPTKTDEELNLSVLQRHDNSIISLDFIAPYAVVYVFSPDSQQWEKSGIEGTCFLCRLSSSATRPERYSVVVLNRRGLDNFNVELRSSEDVEITDMYIILQSNADGIPHVYGLWIFSEPPPSSTAHFREMLAQKIQACAEISENSFLQSQNPPGNGHETEPTEGNSVPMAREVSLQELFGQQRQEDDSWSVRSHSPQREQIQPQPPTQPPQFVPSADTDFFRTPKRHAKPPSPSTVSAQSNGQPENHLLDLFKKAGEGYRAT
ncbi:hypothetical protein MMC09_006066 [Bachmanniomyces sp. S44760]|nr:hypothetical protein [Bachmanniomyces sp. S44760]